MNVDVKPYLPADGILVSGDREKTEQANFNQSAGPAFTLFLDGEMVACGGIRLSVGEAWFLLKESLRKRLEHPNYEKEKKVVLDISRERLDAMTRDGQLYRLYAEARLAERFCRAMGFEKKNNIFVR